MSDANELPAEFLRRHFIRAQAIRPLADAITSARDWRKRLNAIAAYYDAVQPDIAATPRDEWAFDVYEVDWPMLFTPIEAALWCDIRALGIVLYPQYPVRVSEGSRTFFADFANPYGMVAVECDGKTFHNDPARDRERDQLMRSDGWTVYRFSGAECRQDFNAETMQRSSVARELERIARAHLVERHARPAAPAAHRSAGFE